MEISTRLPEEVILLVELCKSEMGASEVWLIGSGARGDHRAESDFDILAVVPDDAPQGVDSPLKAFRLRRQSGAHAELLTARYSDFVSAKTVPNIISYAVVKEGVRLDNPTPL